MNFKYSWDKLRAPAGTTYLGATSPLCACLRAGSTRAHTRTTVRSFSLNSSRGHEGLSLLRRARPLHWLPLDVDDALEHVARVRESLLQRRCAAEVTQLQEAEVDGLALRVYEGHEVVVSVRRRRHHHLRVVLEKVHLQRKNKTICETDFFFLQRAQTS